MPKKSLRWTSDGPIGQMLRREIIKNNYIERGVTAAEVWKNNPHYQSYSLDNFRSNFNKMKGKIKKQSNTDRKSDEALDELNSAFDGMFNFIFYNPSILHTNHHFYLKKDAALDEFDPENQGGLDDYTLKEDHFSSPLKNRLKKEVSFANTDSSAGFDQNEYGQGDIMLPHLLVHWKDAHLYNRCTLFVWGLSGLEPKDIQAKIQSGGRTLRLCFP